LDLATLVGIVMGTVLLVLAIMRNSALTDFVDFASVLIVIGGTIAATLIFYPLSRVLEIMKVVKNAFLGKDTDPAEVINTMVRFAERARREGLLALEDAAAELPDPFLRKGMQLVVDATDPDLVKGILETELAFLEERHKQGAGIFEAMALLAPAFGMIGTLIGLIGMLKTLDDPSTIGPNMAVALLTTFYGALLANFIFLPIAGKLKVRSAEEVLMKEVIIEGILSIQSGDPPRLVEDKLKAFLAPKMRVKEKKAGDEEE
jgi:chemotaxis protein MotA